MSTLEKFAAHLAAQELGDGDVIFVLQGDGLSRAPYAVELFRRSMAPAVAIVGGADNRSYGSYPSREVRDEMVRLGLPESVLFFEEVASHTREEADRAVEMAREKGWKTILIVTSPHHQYRAFLTFLKSMNDTQSNLTLLNAVAPLSMTEETPWGRREVLLQNEFDRIVEYQQKGDVASYEAACMYLQNQKNKV